MNRKTGVRSRTSAPSRRTAQEARESLLDAAELLLLREGPEAIRVVDVAERAGLTHPTLLHHFGSREGLMAALTRRASDRLQVEVNRIFGEVPPAPGRAERTIAAFDHAAAEIEERGLARLLAWLVLAGRHEGGFRGSFEPLVETVHTARSEQRLAAGRQPPSLEESRYGVALVLLQLFGDALFGPVVRRGVGLSDTPEVAAGLRRVLAMLIEGVGPVEPSKRDAPG